MLTKYLNVTEIDSALIGLQEKYPEIAEVVPLKYPTYEKRVCNALRIGKSKSADGVLFTACVHAREWGGAEICISFATDLLESYTASTGRTYGAKSFSALAIEEIVEGLNVIVFPCVNPDGRKFDQANSTALWRKNRNPKDKKGFDEVFDSSIGVDVNRNHSFLWDFKKHFSPDANFNTLSSDNPYSDLYHGSAADSEPETKNIHWLFDTYPQIRWYLDIHCYSGDVLWSWGDDSNQTTNPAMNFRNSAYDGQRGVEGGYGEFISTADLTIIENTAKQVRNAINTVRGSPYRAKQNPYLLGVDTVSYPVSGCGDDYAYARHLVDSSRGKIYSFALEFGFPTGSDFTSFHIPWPEMFKTIPEIDAGMMELCSIAAPTIFIKSPISDSRLELLEPETRKPPDLRWRQKLIPWELWEIYVLGKVPTKPPRPPGPSDIVRSLAMAAGVLWGLTRFVKRIRPSGPR